MQFQQISYFFFILMPSLSLWEEKYQTFSILQLFFIMPNSFQNYMLCHSVSSQSSLSFSLHQVHLNLFPPNPPPPFQKISLLKTKGINTQLLQTCWMCE